MFLGNARLLPMRRVLAGALRRREYRISAHKGDEHARTVSEIQRTVRQLFSERNFEDAKVEARRGKEVAREGFGSDSSVYASMVNNLAVVCKNLGEYEEAADNYSECVKVYSDALGVDHPNTTTAIANLAMLYRNMSEISGEGAESAELLYSARDLLLQTLAARRNKLGPRHIDVAANMRILAGTYRQLGNLDEAESLLGEAISIFSDAEESVDLHIAACRNGLGLVRKGRGDHDGANEEYEEALRLQLGKLDQHHDEVMSTKRNMLENFMAAGIEDRAEELKEELVAFYGEGEEEK